MATKYSEAPLQVELDQDTRIFLAQHFIKTCELTQNPGIELEADLNQEQPLEAPRIGIAFALNGAIVSFTDKVGKQQRDDTLNSIKFAWLAAMKKYNPHRKPTEWFKYFAKILTIICWQMESDEFQKYQSTTTPITLAKVFMQLLAAKTTDPDVKNLTHKTLDAFQKLSAINRASVIFYKNNSTGKSGNFQLDTATQDSNGNVEMLLGAMNFESKQTMKNFLFFEYQSASINLFQTVQKIVLNDKLYANVREQIIDKISKIGKYETTNIPL